jgi:hypothetical protein
MSVSQIAVKVLQNRSIAVARIGTPVLQLDDALGFAMSAFE